MIKKLFNKQIFGILFIIIGLLTNKYIWNQIFDTDGEIAKYHENTIYFLSITFLMLGFILVFSKSEINWIKLKIINPDYIKYFLYTLYVLVIFEITSIFVLKIFLSDEQISDKVDFALGRLSKPSDHVSWMIPDMRSDYKPNNLSTRHNIHGFRFGGKNKDPKNIRILCIGGSTTWGYDDDTLNTYPAQLQFYLQNKGYKVDVINAGVPYHTSLDVLMRYITKGIYTDPDILLVHTGGNDIGPLRSPFTYQPDYTHWRDYGIFGYDIIFKELWEKIPLSFFRIILIRLLKPGTGNKISSQSSYLTQEMLAKNTINRQRAIGLENYFESIISISKSRGIIPVTILFNTDNRRENSYAKKKFTGQELDYAINSESKGVELHNSIMDSISKKHQIDIIPFNLFEPSEQNFWNDQCHLNSDGKKEKSIFIGNHLIKSGILTSFSTL